MLEHLLTSKQLKWLEEHPRAAVLIFFLSACIAFAAVLAVLASLYDAAYPV